MLGLKEGKAFAPDKTKPFERAGRKVTDLSSIPQDGRTAEGEIQEAGSVFLFSGYGLIHMGGNYEQSYT